MPPESYYFFKTSPFAIFSNKLHHGVGSCPKCADVHLLHANHVIDCKRFSAFSELLQYVIDANEESMVVLMTEIYC